MNTEYNIEREKLENLIHIAGHTTRRRILTHYLKLDYPANSAGVLNIKSADVRFHLKVMCDAGLIELSNQKKFKKQRENITQKGGNRGVAFSYYQATDIGRYVLSLLAPAAQPVKFVKVERQPFTPI